MPDGCASYRDLYLRFAGDLRKGRVRFDGPLTFAESGLFWPASSAVVVETPLGQDGLDAALDKAVHHYSGRGLSWVLMTPPEADDRAYAAHGLSPSRPLEAARETDAETEGLEIRPHDLARFPDFAEVVGACLQLERPLRPEDLRPLEPAGFEAFVGYAGGEPVAVAMFYKLTGADGAAVGFVAVPPEHRAHGYGPAILRHALLNTAMQPFLVDGTPAGLPLYAGEGFESCSVYVYTDRPARFPSVFEAELREIAARRAKAGQPAAHLRDRLAGLAFSGGGIRSATFCLGVAQAASEAGKLDAFDYLSTVSGGGYLGGWWSAWLKRWPSLFPPPEQIEPERRVPYCTVNSAGIDPLHHLRLFSNYLTPRKGALSADTWRAAATLSRNILLTWLVLFPVLMAMLLAGQLYFVLALPAPVLRGFLRAPLGMEGEVARVLAYPLVMLAGWIGMLIALWMFERRDYPTMASRVMDAIAAVFAVSLAACLALLIWPWQTVTATAGRWWPLLALWMAGIPPLYYVAVWRGRKLKRRIPAEVLRNRIVRVHAGLLVTLALAAVVLALAGFGHSITERLAATRLGNYGLPVLAALAGAAIAKLLSHATPAGGGEQRKTEAPSGGLVLAFAPPLLLLVLAVAASWLGTQLLAWVSGPGANAILGWAAWIASVVFLFMYGAEISRRLRHAYMPMLTPRAKAMLLFLAAAWVLTVANLAVTHTERWLVFHALAALLVVAVAWVVALGWTADPNLLSMHNFYKARLTRAYMGASNASRVGANVTESVPDDDVPLHSLRNCDRGAPYHLINTTLNLVAGRDLATAQRSAAPFVLSQLYCGSGYTGYRPTRYYMDGRMQLGTAVAISGAAASPNMGSKTPTSAMAMLMTLFNVRLGYWAPTPNQPAWQASQAELWPYYVLNEFFSQTNALTSYCYLSDGGHFENSALYALVERGCRYIVVVDCGADPGMCFEDLGTAVRRCRIDFGAEIELDLGPLARRERHFAVGTIWYSPTHLARQGRNPKGVRKGRILIVKPTKVGDETVDVRQYGVENKEFPQQSTGDQWFGEDQFESYRRLGLFSGRQAFEFIGKFMWGGRPRPRRTPRSGC